jgi:hypothetical protein
MAHLSATVDAFSDECSARECGSEVGEALGNDSPPDRTATLVAVHETGLGEDLGVVRHPGLGLAERTEQVTGAVLASVRDEAEQAQTDGVAERKRGRSPRPQQSAGAQEA